MKPFSMFITESVIDIPKNNLDPTVFQFPDDGTLPFLNPSIKKQILGDVDNFAQIITLKRFYIVGSILTRTYNEDSDIDVSIEVHKEDVDDLMQGKLLSLIKLLNGKLATGTTHPINYYIVLNDPDEERFDAMYDVANDKWLKEPQNVELNLVQYLNNFQKVVSAIDLTIAQLKRDIIDYDTLNKFSKDEIKNLQVLLKRKLYEITEKVEALVDIRNVIKRKRNKAFVRPMTPEELQQYKSKNYLPENIIEKMLQRYYYWSFIEKLAKILEDRENEIGGDQSLTADDIQSIKVVQKNTCIKTFEQFVENPKNLLIQEKIRKIKLQKVDWKNPKSRSFLHNVSRGMNRKTMQQVPISQRPNLQSLASSNIGSAKKIIEVAKNAPSGIWRLTPSQVKWLAAKYHHIPPNAHKNIKHLGNTGIIVWRKSRGVYYLVKQSSIGHREF